MLRLPEYSGSFQGSGYVSGAEKEKVRASDVRSFFLILKLFSKYLFLKHLT